MKPLLTGLLAGTVFLSLNSHAAPPVVATDALLRGHNGMTLYVFDKDVPGSGQSACHGPCASNWPPLVAQDGATPSGDYSIITRNDGTRQWAFKGKPLYFWIKDQQPGDTTGDGFNNVWHAAKP